MIFGIRPAKPDDLVYLQDCDLKSFDYGWNAEEWAFAVENYAVKIAHFYGTPIGFAVMAVVTEPDRIAHLFKVAVKQSFRNRKVGRLLIAETIAFAKHARLRDIESVVPETLCRPGEPQDITGWLSKVGFKGTGVIRNYIQNMGVNEDGFKFNLRF